ncbi:MAG TPA: hypothetical protein VNO21_19945 [Polyangiaceae bacterium]|nr:hypothetical protein [Polyangiaceae bacterium]
MVKRNTRGYRSAVGLIFVTVLALPLGCASEQGSTSSGDTSAPAPYVGTQLGSLHAKAATSRLGMSAMGGAAKAARVASQRAVTGTLARSSAAAGKVHSLSFDTGPGDEGDDEGGYTETVAGGQAETSIAIDATGQHIVIGANDTRGFFNPTTSVSGFAYSDDGGKTFVDGGQLPTPGDFVLAGVRYPQVFGDPDIKYLGQCNFVYSSILVSKFTEQSTVQGMGIHRSRDCGHTWEGPFTIPASNNPTGQTQTVNGVVLPVDAADKEYLDVDPETGRVMIAWSNFTTGGEQLSIAYSDDVLTAAVPTWSKQIVVGGALEEFDQSAISRFAGNGSSNVYASWSIRAIATDPTGLQAGIGFARSLDNGATWQAPIAIAKPFKGMDQVPGNDRVHDFPGLAVDNSGGKHKGTIYVAYANNELNDGADISFQRSTDGGATFSAPITLNSRPGHDRAQWFPWVAVDRDTGRVHVFYFDQGLDTTGDLTETTETFSDDGGVTWSRPRPISARPFKAGWGNDTGQPNIGDYSQAVAQKGELFAEFGSTAPTGFADGQPNLVFPSFPIPDATFARVASRVEDATLGGAQLGQTSFREIGPSNGFLDPGDFAFFDFPVINSVTNPLNATTLRDVTGELATSTPGVVIANRTNVYPDIAAGATAKAFAPYVVRLARDFVPGTAIEFTLDVRRRGQQVTRLFLTQQTGTPSSTVVFAENFDAAPAGALPAGWRNLHQGGANVVPWKTSASFCKATSPGAFHAEADDGPVPSAATRFERLISPNILVPPDSQYVTLDYDVCYDTEDDPNFNIQAFDGFLLRFFDITEGRYRGPSTTDPGRNALAEAFETEFTTDGSFKHYPKHFPRSGDVRYFQDMSAWAGDSKGLRHVHQRFGGMQGSTFQIRFEFTQDDVGTCADVRPGHACGVFVDNLVLRSVKSVVPPPR